MADVGALQNAKQPPEVSLRQLAVFALVASLKTLKLVPELIDVAWVVRIGNRITSPDTDYTWVERRRHFHGFCMAIQEADRNKLGVTWHRTALAAAGAQTGWWPQVGCRNRSLLVIQTAVRHQNRLGNRAKLTQECPVGVDIKAIGCAKRWLRIGCAAPDIDAGAVRVVLTLLNVRVKQNFADNLPETFGLSQQNY